MPRLLSTLASIVLLANACVHWQPSSAAAAEVNRVNVQLVSDEAELVATLLRERAMGHTPSEADWQRLFASQGYRHLAERERSMHPGFGDSLFKAFVLSDTLLARAPEFERTLVSLEHVEVAAARALA